MIAHGRYECYDKPFEGPVYNSITVLIYNTTSGKRYKTRKRFFFSRK